MTGSRLGSRLLRFRRIVDDKKLFEYEVVEGVGVGRKGVMSGALIRWMMLRKHMELTT